MSTSSSSPSSKSTTHSTQSKQARETDRTDLLAEIFSSQVRADVLSWMMSRRDTGYSLTDLSRALGLAVSSVQHEVYKLERLGILLGRRDGSSRRYRLTLGDPLTQALESLVIASIGVDTAFRTALQGTDGLDWATLATASPDAVEGATLVLVGDLELSGLASLQERVSGILGIDPAALSMSFFSNDLWRQHQQDGHPLVDRLRSLVIIANYGEIA
jgi:DNA-binding transcriptional ArsR family regulator